MPVRDLLRRWSRDRGGATAVEFAFVLPIAAMLVIGTMSAAQLLSVINGMHFAVEEAARCSAVNRTVCSSPSATAAYAAARYVGGGTSPVFVANSTGCGHTVTARTNFELMIAVTTIDVPLSATSCFPGVDSAA